MVFKHVILQSNCSEVKCSFANKRFFFKKKQQKIPGQNQNMNQCDASTLFQSQQPESGKQKKNCSQKSASQFAVRNINFIQLTSFSKKLMTVRGRTTTEPSLRFAKPPPGQFRTAFRIRWACSRRHSWIKCLWKTKGNIMFESVR